MDTMQYRVTLPVEIVKQLTDYATARHRTPRDVLVQLIGEHCSTPINEPLISKQKAKPKKSAPRIREPEEEVQIVTAIRAGGYLVTEPDPDVLADTIKALDD